jgi:hypothetical protein
MHAIDSVLRPRLATDPAARQEAMSEKKMGQGDAAWATRKTVLGWVLDSVSGTLELPERRLLRAQSLFVDLQHAKRVSEKRWHQVLGELRSMLLAIPGGGGLFSILQTGFRHTDKHRIRLDSPMRDQLRDLHALINDLAQRPTRLAEVVHDDPWCIGACDASGRGMGGVWLHPEFGPLLWRAPFSAALADRLVSSSNPSGDLTNSDLELAAVLTHTDILAQHYDIRERAVAVLSDNVSAVSWSKRKSVTTRDPAAYLLRLASLHQRHYRYQSSHDHIAGTANTMADDCSRLWFLTDAQLLAHFEQEYRQPLPWTIATPRSAMLSAVTSALHRKRVEPHSFLNEPTLTIPRGHSGSSTAANTDSTRCSTTSATPSHTSWYSPSAIGTAPSPRAVSLCELAQWKTPCVPSARRWPCWGPRTAVSPMARSTSGSPGY